MILSLWSLVDDYDKNLMMMIFMIIRTIRMITLYCNQNSNNSNGDDDDDDDDDDDNNDDDNDKIMYVYIYIYEMTLVWRVIVDDAIIKKTCWMTCTPMSQWYVRQAAIIMYKPFKDLNINSDIYIYIHMYIHIHMHIFGCSKNVRCLVQCVSLTRNYEISMISLSS